MFAEFGPAPLCLELDLNSYEGPWQHVSRFRNGLGWLLVARCTIQSEHDILTAKLVAACDEQENPIPTFQARHLTECGWSNPTYCDELAPGVLDDLICEEEGELIRRWHREKNAGLAEAFEAQEARIAELEGKVRLAMRRNERRIAELRQRRRHPSAALEMRIALDGVIQELSDENDTFFEEMSATRRAIRDQAAAYEETLWARDDLLVEVEPLHVVRWSAGAQRRPDNHFKKRRYGTQYIPASGRTGGADPEVSRLLRRSFSPPRDMALAPELKVMAQPLQPRVAPVNPRPFDYRSKKLYARLAKALAKAERLALVVERSSPGDPHLAYNERQRSVNAKQIMLLEAQIAALPPGPPPGRTTEEGPTDPRTAEDQFIDPRECAQLDNERANILDRWMSVDEARASAAEGSYQPAMADGAFTKLRERLDEVEACREAIDRADAIEREASPQQGEAPATSPTIVTAANGAGDAAEMDEAAPRERVSDPSPPARPVHNALAALAAAQRRYYRRD